MAASGGGGPITPEAFEGGARAAVAQTVDAADASSFGVLARPVAASDSVPSIESAGLGDGSFAGVFGGNLALARQASGFDAGGAWVVPGAGSVCLIADPTYTAGVTTTAHLLGGAVCAGDRAAIAGEMEFTGYAATKNPGHTTIAGLVSDGVMAVSVSLKDGTVQTLPVHDNVYMANLNGTPAAIAFVNGNGTRVTQAVGSPHASQP